MPKKGNYTQEDATRAGLIPAGPIGRVIDRWACQYDDVAYHTRNQEWMDVAIGGTKILSERTGISQDTISRVRNGRKPWLEFDNADKIIISIDPFLWHSDPDLSDIYQNFDFSNLDLSRPTCDELGLLDGLSNTVAAAVFGVSKETMSRRRKQMEEAA